MAKERLSKQQRRILEYLAREIIESKKELARQRKLKRKDKYKIERLKEIVVNGVLRENIISNLVVKDNNAQLKSVYRSLLNLEMKELIIKYIPYYYKRCDIRYKPTK